MSMGSPLLRSWVVVGTHASEFQQLVTWNKVKQRRTSIFFSEDNFEILASIAHGAGERGMFLREPHRLAASLEDGPSACRRTYALPVGVVPWEAVTGTAADNKVVPRFW